MEGNTAQFSSGRKASLLPKLKAPSLSVAQFARGAKASPMPFAACSFSIYARQFLEAEIESGQKALVAAPTCSRAVPGHSACAWRLRNAVCMEDAWPRGEFAACVLIACQCDARRGGKVFPFLWIVLKINSFLTIFRLCKSRICNILCKDDLALINKEC